MTDNEVLKALNSGKKFTGVCFNRVRNTKGVIIGYELNIDDFGTMALSSEAIKKYMKSGVLNVTNLKLTSDNRVYWTDISDDENFGYKKIDDKHYRMTYGYFVEHNNSNLCVANIPRLRVNHCNVLVCTLYGPGKSVAIPISALISYVMDKQCYIENYQELCNIINWDNVLEFVNWRDYIR